MNTYFMNWKDYQTMTITADDLKKQDEEEWIDPWPAPYTVRDAYIERPPAQFIIKSMIKLPSLNMLYGSPGSMKTLLALDMCISIAAGLPFLEPAPWSPAGASYETIKYPTAFIDFDNGENELHERIEAMCRAKELKAEDLDFYYWSFPDPGLDAGDEKSIGDLIQRMNHYGIKFLSIDNLGIIKGRADENTDQMIPVMNNLRQAVLGTSAAINLIHHQRKGSGVRGRDGESIRGHSSIEASLNLALMTKREDYSDTVKVVQGKQRGYTVLPFSIVFTYTHHFGNNTLETAKFFSIATQDVVSDAAIESTALEVLEDGDLNKTKLRDAIKEHMEEASGEKVGLVRISHQIDLMVMKKLIRCRDGKGTEKIYSKQ